MLINGIRIDEITRSEAIAKMGIFLTTKGQQAIFTPNPEMVVKAEKDPEFKKVLNWGALNICDGRGLEIVARFQKIPLERIPGVDFMIDLCGLAAKNQYGIFLLGSENQETVGQAVKALEKKFPGLQVTGFHPGPHIIEDVNQNFQLKINAAENEEVLQKIRAACPLILFVAFGMGKQEKWIRENLSRLPSVKIAVGVGGAFDYLSGRIPRAPLLLRKLGLEWCYRLWREPKRLRRICNATFYFLYIVLCKKGSS